MRGWVDRDRMAAIASIIRVLSSLLRGAARRVAEDSPSMTRSPIQYVQEHGA
jgi:hypothetical protein